MAHIARWIARLGILAGILATLALVAAPVFATPSLDEQPATPPPSAAAGLSSQSAGPASVQVTYTAFLPIVHKPPLPAAFAKLSPAANAINIPATGTVLSWTASYAASVYDVCISPSVVGPCIDGSGSGGFTNTTAATAWGTGPLVPGQIYFWHVRARNDSGVTYSDGSVGQARQFTVTPLPGAFNKGSPASGSINHPATGITLTWGASANATGYQVCLSTSASQCNNAASYTINLGVVTSYNTGALAPDTTYYWNVRAINNNGQAHVTYANGGIGQIWNFRTLALPGAFNKLQPANGSSPANATLSWEPSAGATGYRLCLNTSPAPCVGAGGGYTIDTVNTTYNATGLTPGVTYFWHVRAYNASGVRYSNNSESAVWNFLGPAATGGTDPCNASIAAQNTDYTTVQDRPDIYYAIVVNQASTVDLSITGATGQLQFRTPNSATCPSHNTTLIDYEPVNSGAASLRYYNVTPGTYYVRIATSTPGSNNVTFRWSATPGYTFHEPNNTACAPATINVDTTYTAYPENSRPDLDLGSGVGAENDFYQFTLSAQTTVQIQFSSYNGGNRQVQLRGGPCASSSLVDGSAFVANAISGTIQRTLAAGTYWVRFVTLDGTQSRTPYTFRVATSSGTPRVDTCNPSGSPNCELQPGPNATIYWFNMPSGTSLTLRLDGQTISGGTCGSQAQGRLYGPVTISVNGNGSYTFNNVGNGYYAAGATWTGAATGGDSKPLKIGCTLLALSEPEALGPPSPANQTTTDGAAPRPTPIPLPGETPTPTPVPPLIVTPIP